MLVFHKIKYKNFLSSGNHFTEIDFRKNNTNLIIGTNGAGKSTMLDALTFVLFNKSFRGITKPQLVNSTNERDCVVEIEFSVNSKNYLVRRGIKPNIFDIEVKDKKKYSIYLVNAKLTSIVQGTPLDEYLSNNLDIHKIVVAKDVAKKVVKQIVSDYTNAEFFFESEMMEDIPSKVFIPVHQLISQEEKNELLTILKKRFEKNETKTAEEISQ